MYALTIALSFGMMSAVFKDYEQSFASFQTVLHLLERETPATSGARMEAFHGTIELQQVSFWYHSKPNILALNQISYKIKQDSIVAIMGSSGQGKSTLLDVLAGIYPVSLGKIMLDDQLDLRIADKEWLYKQIGYQTQQPVIFHATVYENIVYGWKKVDEPSISEVLEASKKVFF